MSEAKIVQKAPIAVELENAVKYWCSCGESANQPYCDGTHKVKGEFTPVKFEIKDKQTVYLCGCKQTSRSPFCDGTHKKL